MFDQMPKICKELVVRDVCSLGTYLRHIPGKVYCNGSRGQINKPVIDNVHGKLIEMVILPAIFTMMKEFR
jgi:hypothetical protein